MKILMTIIVVISAIGLIATVLLQSGKSAGLSGAITGGAETFFEKKVWMINLRHGRKYLQLSLWFLYLSCLW